MPQFRRRILPKRRFGRSSQIRTGLRMRWLKGWTRLIHLTTNGGHPLLVSAKVASLKARSWPESALLEDFGATVSDAVRATRDEARRRLIDEIPSVEARQLLRRVGCIFDRADEGLVLALARDDPSIANAGDALVTLRGSWIEIMPGGDLRLSPLIADIASDVPEEGSSSIVEQLLNIG